MKKFVGFYYRCSFKVCLCAFLSLIGLMFLSSSAFALQSGRDITVNIASQAIELTPTTTTTIPQYGDFTYTVNANGTVTITKYTGAGGDVVIPSTIDGMPVVGIGGSAFYSRTSLTSVTIPDSVTSIGYEVFYNCSGLTSVIIPNSVTSIGNSAFRGCSGLTSVIIGNSVTRIGYEVFYNCYGLTSVTIPDSVTSIGSYAFYLCSGLTSVTIGNSVTSIGDIAFGYCSALTSVTIGNSVTSIGDNTFYFCSGLTSVTIPNSVTSIGSAAFGYCSGLTSVIIGNSVTRIGYEVFYNCYGLTSIVVDTNNAVFSSQDGVLYDKAATVLILCPLGKSGGFTIPDSVTGIGSYAFYGCSGLTSVIIPNSVTSIGSYAFGYCRGLTSVIIPNSVTSIGDNAFLWCRGLTSVTIGNSVTSIGDIAFYSCTSLTSVTIPNSVTGIGSYAFYGCSGLAKAYFDGNAPTMGSYVFVGCASNFSVCYTEESTGFKTPTWYGYPTAVCVPPTVINLSSFTATPKAGKVILQWNTESEIDNAGFNLYRSTSETGEYLKINDSLISAKGSSTQGATYEFVDKDVKNRQAYYYKLEDADLNGVSTMHGPVSATPRWLFGIFSIFGK